MIAWGILGAVLIVAVIVRVLTGRSKPYEGDKVSRQWLIEHHGTDGTHGRRE